MKEKSVLALLISMYLAGMAGIRFGVHPDFILLTPLSLLAAAFFALYFHRPKTRDLWIFVGFAYLWGFFAELFGVQTGILFGDYSYGRVLGIKVWETPLMIGVNWILVSYTTGVAISRLAGRAPKWLRAILGAATLVLLDLFIEPVAIRYGMWSWEAGEVPLRNYLGWFLVALPVQAFFVYRLGLVVNKVALVLFVLQFAFFIFLGI